MSSRCSGASASRERERLVALPDLDERGDRTGVGRFRESVGKGRKQRSEVETATTSVPGPCSACASEIEHDRLGGLSRVGDHE